MDFFGQPLGVSALPCMHVAIIVMAKESLICEMRPYATCMLNGWHEYTRAYTMPPMPVDTKGRSLRKMRGEVLQASLVRPFLAHR